MKSRKFVFVFILTIISLYIPKVYAKNYSAIGTETTNGWYLVKSLTKENDYNWAYYEDGVEKKRYSYMYAAHMGWTGAARNSLAAFKLTKENGFYANETDIRFTNDNVPILSHDSLSNYDGKTTLQEALIWASENNMIFALELKEGTREQIEAVVRMVKQYDMQDRVIYYSFEDSLLKFVKDYDGCGYLRLLDKSKYPNTYPGVAQLEQEPLTEIYNNLKTDNNLVSACCYSSNNKDKIVGQSFNFMAPSNPELWQMNVKMSDKELPVLVEEETEINDETTENTREQTEINVPSTGINIPLYLKIIGVLVVISGVTIIIKVQNKRTL